MPVRIPTPEHVARAQAELRALDTPHLDAEIEASAVDGPPVIRNARAVRALAGDGWHDVFEWRPGRRFRVPPIPVEDGLDLLRIQEQFTRLSAALLRAQQQAERALEAAARTGDVPDLSQLPEVVAPNQARYVALAQEARAIFWRLVRPVRLWDRLLWRWLSNPFGNATMAEVGVSLTFFCGLVRKSYMRLPTLPASESPSSTASRTSSLSAELSPPSPMPAASRGATTTTASGFVS